MHRAMQAHAHAHPDACDIATSRSKCSSRHTRVHHSARFVLTCTSYVVHNVALVVPRSDGFITVPEVPGLGVDIDIEECLKYPSTGNINQPDAGHGACCAAPCRAVLRCAARCCAPPHRASSPPSRAPQTAPAAAAAVAMPAVPDSSTSSGTGVPLGAREHGHTASALLWTSNLG